MTSRNRLVVGAVCGAALCIGVVSGLAGAGVNPARHGYPTVMPARLAYRHGAASHYRRGAVSHYRGGPGSHYPHGAASHRPTGHASRCRGGPPPVPERPIRHRQWLTGVVITEYYPAPERWFVGRRASAPGLSGTHAVDWLYSARGLAMEGDGVDLRGRPAHIAQLGTTGWVDASGRPTASVCLGKWTAGPPAWLHGGWRNASGAVTFPLASGGWSNGRGVHVLGYGDVTFAAGPSLPLHYYHSLAVDPRLIPLGSRVYIPAYRDIGGGWFVAQDTGGAIKGHHVDVYRAPPATPADEGRYLTGERILVIPPS